MGVSSSLGVGANFRRTHVSWTPPRRWASQVDTQWGDWRRPAPPPALRMDRRHPLAPRSGAARAKVRAGVALYGVSRTHISSGRITEPHPAMTLQREDHRHSGNRPRAKWWATARARWTAEASQPHAAVVAAATLTAIPFAACPTGARLGRRAIGALDGLRLDGTCSKSTSPTFRRGLGTPRWSFGDKHLSQPRRRGLRHDRLLNSSAPLARRVPVSVKEA